MTQKEFSDATGIAPASLSSIFNGRTAPTMKHAEALHRYFPSLNMGWLLFGEGEMFSTGVQQPQSGATLSDQNQDVSDALSVASEDPASDLQHTAPILDVEALLPGAASGIVKPSAPSSRKTNPSDAASRQQANLASAPAAGATTPRRQRPHESVLQSQPALSVSDKVAMQQLPYGSFYGTAMDAVNIPNKPPRKIVEIRVFFDDGTYETFKGN